MGCMLGEAGRTPCGNHKTTARLCTYGENTCRTHPRRVKDVGRRLERPLNLAIRTVVWRREHRVVHGGLAKVVEFD